MTVAEAIIEAVRYYAVAGGVVAALFLTIGVGRIDPSARGSYLFRILAIPGTVGLWPLVLVRWWRLEQRGAT